MLDTNLQYSCGYWRTAQNLDEAQLAKMDLIARKLQLKPGMRVLDIGCGYGTLAKFFASHYGVSVVGVTISEEQVKYAKEICVGLPCEFRLCDYRDLVGELFDRVLTVGMMEHVGPKNHAEFLSICRKCLKDDGLALLHFIATMDWRARKDWINHKYIFRNSEAPHFVEVAQAIDKTKWVMEDWHNFGWDYSRTLDEWDKNFEKDWSKKETAARGGKDAKDPLNKLRSRYEDSFYKMWKLYLQFASVLFRMRRLQLWQIVLSKTGVSGGYQSER